MSTKLKKCIIFAVVLKFNIMEKETRVTRFFLRTNKKKGKAPLYIRVRTKTGEQIPVNTGIKVNIAEWVYAISSHTKWENYKIKEERLSSNLYEIERGIKKLIKKKSLTKETITALVSEIAGREDEIKKIEKEIKEKELAELNIKERERAEAEKRERERLEKLNIWQYVARHCQEVKSGERGTLRKNKDYAESSLKVWNAFLVLYSEFDSKHEYKWTDIDEKFARRFKKYLEKRGYMKKTINKYICSMKVICKRAYKDNTSESDTSRYFFFEDVLEQDKAREIYLTAQELQSLYEMPLEGRKAEVRDIFLVGCYTCQRFSDYSRLSKDSFRVTARGTEVVSIVQEKTKTSVSVPILSPNLKAIAEKYDYKFPVFKNNVVFNRYIKEILKELSESVESLARKERTLLNVREQKMESEGRATFERDESGNVVKPRYELVSSHTARRTGITLMYLTKKFNIFEMMYVSGHKSQSVFLDYIKLSGQEIADDIGATVKDNEIF